MFKYEPVELSGLDKNKRSEKFSMAVNYSEKCLNGDEFKAWFLAQKFKQLGEFELKTNEELLAILLRPVYCDYYVVARPWYKRFSSVIGWTNMFKRVIGALGKQTVAQVSTYSDQFDAMSVSGLAGHLAHEIGAHGNGFSHSFNWVKDRDSSLPYLVGNFVEAWVSKNKTIH